MDCGALPDPQFGDVFLSGTFFQSTATYQCFNGYTISGSGTRTCQANGRWSGVEPTCKRKLYPIHILYHDLRICLNNCLMKPYSVQMLSMSNKYFLQLLIVETYQIPPTAELFSLELLSAPLPTISVSLAILSVGQTQGHARMMGSGLEWHLPAYVSIQYCSLLTQMKV